jgi:hypothetical protein
MSLAKEDKMLCRVLLFFLYALVIANFLRIFKIEESYIVIINGIIYGLIGVFAVCHCIYNKRFFPHIFVLVGLGTAFCVSIIINNQILPLFLKNLPYLIGFFIVGFYLSYELNNYNYFFELLKKFVPLGSIFSILYFSHFDFNKSSYSMSVSYLLLLPAISSFKKVQQDKNIINLFFLLSILLTIVVIGSRGPVICFCLFVLLDYIFRMSIRGKIGLKLVLKCLFSVFLLLVFIVNLDNGFLISLFPESRTLNMIADASFFTNYSGRNPIYRACIEYIMNNPTRGMGIFGDRIYLVRELFLSSDAVLYPHNLFFELFMQYGVVLGMAFCLLGFVIFYEAIKIIVNVKNNVLADLFVLFLSLGLIPLMFSGSYIVNNNFGVFLGFCLNLCFKARVTSTNHNKA